MFLLPGVRSVQLFIGLEPACIRIGIYLWKAAATKALTFQ